MCCDDPAVSKQVNSAKCAGIGAMVVGLITMVLGLCTLAVGGVAAFLGGLLATIGGSMLTCCGPKVKAQGNGLHTGALVLFIIAAVVSGIATILVAVLVAEASSAVGSLGAACTYGDKGCKIFTNTAASTVGVIGVIGVLFYLLSFAFDIWAAVATAKAMKQIKEEIVNLQRQAQSIGAVVVTGTALPKGAEAA